MLLAGVRDELQLHLTRYEEMMEVKGKAEEALKRAEATVADLMQKLSSTRMEAQATETMLKGVQFALQQEQAAARQLEAKVRVHADMSSKG